MATTFTRSWKGNSTTSTPPGVLQRSADGKFTISVRRWSEVIHEARARLQFVQKELNYEVNRDHALERLRATYAHLLGGEEPSGSDTVDAVEDQDEDEQQLEPEPDDEPVA